MRLERADMFINIADDISVTDMVRIWRPPPVRELGEADDKCVAQNS